MKADPDKALVLEMSDLLLSQADGAGEGGRQHCVSWRGCRSHTDQLAASGPGRPVPF